MPVKKFEMLSDSKIRPEIKRGAIVYAYQMHDYGCASDDTRMTGIEHKTFTIDPEGLASPFFTHLATGVREIKE
jgi:hypothetical protein